MVVEGEFRGKTIFGEQYLPGTSSLLKDWFNRHVILRANATPADLADWMNQADAVCEECEHFIPVAAASNSRNENGELVFGMNDAGGVLATWPGTLGIAAAVKGSKIDLVDKFADTIRREWNACGLRKGYMYMADAVTDPRWQRTYGTFGEDPALISEIMAHIIGFVNQLSLVGLICFYIVFVLYCLQRRVVYYSLELLYAHISILGSLLDCNAAFSHLLHKHPEFASFFALVYHFLNSFAHINRLRVLWNIPYHNHFNTLQ